MPTEGFLVWGRYLSWLDLNRARFHEALASRAAESNETTPYVAAAAHFFASLWVAVEGYRELHLRDNFVNAILENPPGYADLLRRCRNGVYHFQPEFIEPRFQAFHDRIQTTYPWAEALRGELIRVFWQFPEIAGWSQEEVNQWRDSAYELLDWLPQDTIYMNIILIERDLDELEALAQGQSSEHPVGKVATIKFSAEEEERFRARWEAERKTTEASQPKSPEKLRRSLSKMRSDLLKQQQRYREAGWLGGGPAV